jgi:hypothetical protein
MEPRELREEAGATHAEVADRVFTKRGERPDGGDGREERAERTRPTARSRAHLSK